MIPPEPKRGWYTWEPTGRRHVFWPVSHWAGGFRGEYRSLCGMVKGVDDLMRDPDDEHESPKCGNCCRIVGERWPRERGKEQEGE
jgi:hypothetical protein